MIEKIIECRGMKKTYSEWERHPECEVKASCIKSRINRGASAENAIFYPKKQGRTRIAAKYKFGSELLTVREISDRTDMNIDSVRVRCKRGEDISKSVTMDENGFYIASRNMVVNDTDGNKVTRKVSYKIKANLKERASQIDGIAIPGIDDDLPLKNLIASLTAMGFKGDQLLAEARKRVVA